MVQSITNDSIFWAKNSLEEASISIKTTWEEDRIIGFIIVSNDFLQIFVDILSATDEADGAHSKTMRIQSILCGLDKTRMVGKPQIVVGTKIEDTFIVGGNFGGLRACDNPFTFVSACLFDGL